MQHDQHMLLVLHAVPHHSDHTREGRLFLHSSEGWQSSHSGAGIGSLHKHLDQYEKAVEQLDEREQQATDAQCYLDLLEELTPVMRSSRNLLQVLEEARKAEPDIHDLIDARDRAYDISRNADLLYSDIKNAMDVALVRQAEEQARASAQMTAAAHRLNVLAALFFPTATLGAIFGTVFTDGWNTLSNSWIPFIVFLGASVLSGLITVSFIVRPVRPDKKTE